MATVTHVEHPNGDHSIGVEIDGVFTPFATLPAARVAHHSERVASLTERADAGDEYATEVLAGLGKASAKDKKDDGTKGGGS